MSTAILIFPQIFWFWCRKKDKDIVFLKAVSDIVEQVGKGDWMHTEEHKTINNNLVDWHAKINNKLEDMHKDIKKKK